jgi:WhiB family transcriptional regulator, redox-sensing transcriptional regulator
VKRAQGLWWSERAACRGHGELFFGPSDGGQEERTKAERQRVAAAIAFCAVCPVQPDCLLWAMRKPEIAGIWGGLTQRQRALLYRKLTGEKVRAPSSGSSLRWVRSERRQA